MPLDDPEIDWESEAILTTLEELDREATTSELRELTGIDDNRKILYRIREKLVPKELVEIKDTDPEMTGGRIPPTRTQLTSKGKELAQEIDEDRGRVTDVTDRIESVEADLNKITHLQTELSELQERVEGIEEAGGGNHSGQDDPTATELEELNQRVSFLWDAVLAIRNFLEAEHGIELKEYIEEVDTDAHTLESG